MMAAAEMYPRKKVEKRLNTASYFLSSSRKVDHAIMIKIRYKKIWIALQSDVVFKNPCIIVNFYDCNIALGSGNFDFYDSSG